MARPRSKPYKPGDKMSISIPMDIDKDILDFINQPKWLSPVVMSLIRDKVRQEKEIKQNAGKE